MLEIPTPDRFLPCPLVDGIRDVAARYPDMTAADDGRDHLTYRELLEAAGRVVAALADARLPRNAAVALLLTHSTAMITGIVGVLGAGLSYVPLSPNDPPERWAMILRDVGCRTLIVDRVTAAWVPADAPLDLVVDLSSLPVAGAALAARAEGDRAYVLFTSGSTGAPKGVVQTSEAVHHHGRAYARSIELTPRDRVALLAPYYFDAAVMDIFASLLTGSALHIRDVRNGGLDHLNAWLREKEITILHGTPSLIRAVLSPETPLPSVRRVVFGGEALRWDDVALVRGVVDEACIIINGYGPSECSTAAQFRIGPKTPLGQGVVPIGRPISLQA